MHDNRCEKATIENESFECNNRTVCGSGETVFKVDLIDDDLDAKPPVDALDAQLVLASDSDAGGLCIDTPLNVNRLKRKLDEGYLIRPGSPKKAKKPRSAAPKGTKKSKVSKGPRVGCPFYKKDPIEYQSTISCHGTGFEEIAKVKDHLKEKHKIPIEWCTQNLNFKTQPFLGCTLEVKWKLAFQRLFPEVPNDEIPSPYIHGGVMPPARSDVTTKDMEALGKIIKNNVIEHYKIELMCELPLTDFEIAFDKLFNLSAHDWKLGTPLQDKNFLETGLVEEAQNITQEQIVSAEKDLDKWYLGYPTLPTSIERLPQGNQLEVSQFTGLPMSSRLSKHSLYEPFPTISEDAHMPPHFGSNEDYNGNPTTERGGEIDQVPSKGSSCTTIFPFSGAQDYAFTFKSPNQSIPMPAGHDYRSSGSFVPVAGVHAPVATADSKLCSPPMHSENPFMGPKTASDLELALLLELKPTGVPLPPSTCFGKDQEELNLDDFLDVESYTSSTGGLVQTMPESFEDIDKLFEI